jgi:hypothetical protein
MTRRRQSQAKVASPKLRVDWPVLLTGTVAYLFFIAIFATFFPAAPGNMGHDYTYFGPALLEGYYWYLVNGCFQVPWFTPAFLGGVPFFANPQNMYYSVPQLLTLFMQPVAAIKVTVFLFAAIGFVGFYCLARRCFNSDKWVALLAAVVFLYNGFYIHRMLIGHFPYHAWMLVPWAAAGIAGGFSGNAGVMRRFAAGVLLPGACIAYMIMAGMGPILLPAIAAVAGILVFREVLTPGFEVKSWGRFAGALVTAGCLAAAKIMAVAAFLHLNPRDLYGLPTARTWFGAVRIAVQSLFLYPPQKYAEMQLTGGEFLLERHAFEYGITVVPLILIAVTVTVGLVEKKGWHRVNMKRAGFLSLLTVFLIMPIFVNVHSTHWTPILEKIPVIKSSSNLLRWFSLYIPLVSLMMVVAMTSCQRLRRFNPLFAVAGITAIIAVNLFTDRTFYREQPYQPYQLIAAYRTAAETGMAPPVTAVFVKFTASQPGGAEVILPRFLNEAMIWGGSQLRAYEPIFGYRLEAFPVKTLHVGSIFDETNGTYNMKNPASFLFPAENGCQPGDHFRTGDIAKLEAFSQRKPFAFEMPLRQKMANVLNLLALVLAGGFLVATLFVELRNRQRQRHRSS